MENQAVADPIVQPHQGMANLATLPAIIRERGDLDLHPERTQLHVTGPHRRRRREMHGEVRGHREQGPRHTAAHRGGADGCQQQEHHRQCRERQGADPRA